MCSKPLQAELRLADANTRRVRVADVYPLGRDSGVILGVVRQGQE
jgi:hypothetical protein